MPDARITDAEIAELRRLCEKATAGPWYTDHEGGPLRMYPDYRSGCSLPLTDNNKDFIAASRTALPRLLDELVALRAALRPYTVGFLAGALERKFNHTGAMNATQLGDRDEYLKVRNRARAALTCKES